MRKLFMIAFLLASVISQAQCKFKVDKIDEFEKVRIRETESRLIQDAITGNTDLSVVQIEDLYFIKIVRLYSHYTSKVVGAEDNLSFLQLNGNVEKLIPVAISAAKNSLISGSERSIITINYQISKDQLLKLSENPIVKYRLQFTDSTEEKEIKTARYERFKTLINCALNTPLSP